MGFKNDINAQINELNTAYNSRWGGTPISQLNTGDDDLAYANQISNILDTTRQGAGIHYSAYPGPNPGKDNKIVPWGTVQDGSEVLTGILEQIRQVTWDISHNQGCDGCKGTCHNGCSSGCSGGCTGCSGCSGKCWSCSGGLWCAGCWRNCSGTCGGGCNGCNGCSSGCQFNCKGTCTNSSTGYSRPSYGSVCDCG